MTRIKRHYIDRDIFEKVAHHLASREITMIIGPRQAGKTVLLAQLGDWLVKSKKIDPSRLLNYNLDLVKDWEFFQDQTSFIEFIKSKSKLGKIYIFVDEAQKVPNAAGFFKGVYDSDLNIKLILSGSSSFELKSKLKESLAGRKRSFSLFPFSFHEYLLSKNQDLIKQFSFNKIPKLFRPKLLQLYFDYIAWGGYPRVVLEKNHEEKINLLAEIYSSYIEKDIVGLLEIKNKLGFSNLFRMLMAQTGQLINIAELANSANLDRETIERYLFALEETFTIKSLKPYYANRRQEIVKQNKIYAVDLGLRNYALENFNAYDKRTDAGFVLENAIHKELNLGLSNLERLRFWRTKSQAEVDFVVIKGETLLPIEIKSAMKQPKVGLGLRSFIEKYAPKKAIIVNLSIYDQKIKMGKCQVHFIHPYEIISSLTGLI